MRSAGGFLDFLFGESGQAPQAFRSPGWQTQGELLNQIMLGGVLTPELLQVQRNLAAQQPQTQPQQTFQTPTQFSGITPRQAQMFAASPGFARFTAPTQQAGTSQADYLQALAPLAAPQFTPGQAISGQIAPTTMANAPMPQFGQRTPFQFSTQFDPTTAVGDAFTPAIQAAQSALQRSGAQQREQIMEDLNRRGLLTGGPTTEAMLKSRMQEEQRLGEFANQLAAEQARAQLGAQQFGAQLGFGQQQAQAEEIFRQQGATDAQAQFLANLALQRQQQGFGQQLAGRQAALGEFGLQQQMRRQPTQDLFQLYQLSTGATPGYQGTPGFLGSALGGVGQGFGTAAGLGLAGLAFCLPKGTQIKTKDGYVNIEDIKPGDYVTGGKVLSTVCCLRHENHKFYLHKFDKGEVIMSDGHPYFDELKSMEVVSHESPYTYDILTEEGHYYVNNVQLSSTLRH